MNDFELGYVVGMFEGEGSFSNTGPSRNGFSLQLVSTDRDVIERLLCITGVGTMNGPRKYGHNIKPYWVWQVARSADSQLIYSLMRPHLCQRRKGQGDEKLAVHLARPFASPENFFEARVDRSGSCHIWTGGYSTGGVPIFSWKKNYKVAYRHVVEREIAPMKLKGQVAHSCGDKRCVKLDHLIYRTR